MPTGSGSASARSASAGLARFRGTPVEALLPVTLPPPPPPDEPPAPPPPSPKPDPKAGKPSLDEGEKEALRVALLLVIDTSGSMSVGNKLQMAQASAIAAARSLSPEDRVSVIAFSDQMIPVAPFQDAVVLAGLLTGFTDSHWFRDRGIAAYGFSPIEASAEQRQAIHGPDENVDVAALERGGRRMTAILRGLAR